MFPVGNTSRMVVIFWVVLDNHSQASKLIWFLLNVENSIVCLLKVFNYLKM